MQSKKSRIKYGEIVKGIFMALAEANAAASAKVHPNIFVIIDEIYEYIKEKSKAKIPKHKIRRAIKVLEKKNILYLEEKKDKVYVHIKDKKNIIVQKYSLKALLDFKRKNKTWDGKWFLVIFDVPEKQKNKRDYMRRFLVDLGFYPYQKSVYIFPYECEKEVKLIKEIVEGTHYMKYIIAQNIEDEDHIKTFFKLK
jgi:CRISPR-associated endonuclease Cas2